MRLTLLIVLSLLFATRLVSAAESNGRFFLEGDGILKVVNPKTNAGGSVRYRTKDGNYPKGAWEEINRIFGVPPKSSEGISLRLIALLDYLQDHFKGATIQIVSGYRSPEYNDRLRKKGKLAAKTSMHIEGMAADINMDGIDGKTLWEFARGLDCCGAGYYHGKGIHIDTGPSRFWDETSAKVDQDLGGHNKLILLRTDQDIYHKGETVHLSLGRITDYPVGVTSKAELWEGTKRVASFSLNPEDTPCRILHDRREAHSLSWIIPQDSAGPDRARLRIGIKFCQKPTEEMPDHTDSNPIQILGN